MPLIPWHYERLKSPAALCLLAVLGLVVLVFHGAFQGYFVQDDYGWLESSRFESLSAYLKCFFQFNPALTYRPLSQETFFWAGQKMFGMNPVGYHAVSLIFHLAGCTALYLVLRCFFSPAPGLAGTLFYGIHAAHQRSVFWISALPEPMALFFFLCAVYLFIRFDRSGNLKWYIPSVAAMGLGMMSKESILTVPLILAAYALLFSPRRILWTAPFFCLSGTYTLLRLTSRAVRAAPYPLTFGHAAWENLLSYLSWSSGLTETMLKVKLGWTPQELYGRIAIVFLAAAAVLLLLARRRKLAVFALIWFVFALQPVLYFWQHIDPYYLAPSLAGLSFLIAAAAPESVSRKTLLRWVPAVLVLCLTLWTATASVKLEGRWWNQRTFVGRNILARMPDVDRQVPPGRIAYVFGFSENEFGVLMKDAALKAAGYPPDRFILCGLDPDTPGQIMNLARHGGLIDYYCFLYKDGEFTNITKAFRRHPDRFLHPVSLEVSPLEVQSGRDILTLKVINLNVRAIDVSYTLNGQVMPPIHYWPLNSNRTATLPVDGSTKKGIYQFTAIRDAEEPDDDWCPVDVRVVVR
jgi:hypothetical protein